MNILCVSAQKPDSTGSGVYLAETVRAFLAAGHQVAVIAGVDAADEPKLPQGARLFTVRFNTPDLPFPVCGMSDQMPYAATRYRDMTPGMVERFRFAFAGKLAEALASFEPNLVICHHLYLVTALVAQAGLTCPVCAVCHSTDLRQMRTHGLEHDFIVEGVRRLDAVLALHQAQAREIVQLYGVDAARVRVVGTGYNAQVFRPQPGLRRAGGIDVVYAGKISRKKGVESLMRCLDALPYAPGEFTLRLAGGHGSAEELARIKQLAATSRYPVEFLGKLSQKDLAREYGRAHVFVLPSFFEGLPLVTVEALACGCRAVLTDLPGIRDWLDDALPGAAVTYVEPPRLVDADEPVAQDLPAFERRLAAAVAAAGKRALNASDAASAASCETGLSWEALAGRMLVLFA